MRDKKFLQVETQQGAATLSSSPKQPPAVEMDEPNFVSRYLRRKMGEALLGTYLARCADGQKDAVDLFSSFFSLVTADIRRIGALEDKAAPPDDELGMAVRWLIAPYFFPVVLSRRSLLWVARLLSDKCDMIVTVQELQEHLRAQPESLKPLTKTFDAQNLQFGEYQPRAFSFGKATRYSLAELLGSGNHDLRRDMVKGLVAFVDGNPDGFRLVRDEAGKEKFEGFSYSLIQERFNLWRNFGFFPPAMGKSISHDTTKKLVIALLEENLDAVKKEETCINRYLFLSELGWDTYCYRKAANGQGQMKYSQNHLGRTFDIRNFQPIDQRRKILEAGVSIPPKDEHLRRLTRILTAILVNSENDVRSPDWKVRVVLIGSVKDVYREDDSEWRRELATAIQDVVYPHLYGRRFTFPGREITPWYELIKGVASASKQSPLISPRRPS